MGVQTFGAPYSEKEMRGSHSIAAGKISYRRSTHFFEGVRCWACAMVRQGIIVAELVS